MRSCSDIVSQKYVDTCDFQNAHFSWSINVKHNFEVNLTFLTQRMIVNMFELKAVATLEKGVFVPSNIQFCKCWQFLGHSQILWIAHMCTLRQRQRNRTRRRVIGSSIFLACQGRNYLLKKWLEFTITSFFTGRVYYCHIHIFQVYKLPSTLR